MRTPRTILFASLAGLSLFGAACSGDDGDTAAAPATTAADQAPTGSMADSMSSTTMGSTADSTTAGDEAGGPFGPACSSVPSEGEGSFAGMTDDTAATAAGNNPLLSTLVSAVGQAGLVDTLNSDGPFTIFAPVNDAFAAIPAADLQAVLADQDALTSVLTYHVVAGEQLSAAELGEAGSATTVNGGTLEFGPDGTTVNGVEVLCSNVMTANATVHLIGEVLMP
ncbi:MAG: fasciclin domain-containing protein [Acidimicrobiales bacterium]